MIKRILAFLISFCLIFEQAGFAQMAIPLGIPGYLSSFAPVADKFRPIHLRSIDLNSGNGNFELILDKGDLQDIKPPQLEETTRELYQYFRVGLALPNKYFWVNLRPDSPDEVIEPLLEKTDVGRVMLAADLQLKKDLANATSPQTPEGKLYWGRLYAKAGELYAQQDIQIPTLTRPWIVPGEIVIRAGETGAFVYKATLKVMLEQDYIKDSPEFNFSDPRQKELNAYSSQLIRELIIPKLTREVNSARRYAQLRQVYFSLILAQWFKSKSQINKIDNLDLNGLTSKAKWSKDTYYQDYRKSFQKGEYNRQEQVSSVSGLAIRQYFSGGIQIMEKPIGEWSIIPSGVKEFFGANQQFFDRLTIDPWTGDIAELPSSSVLNDGGAQQPADKKESEPFVFADETNIRKNLAAARRLINYVPKAKRYETDEELLAEVLKPASRMFFNFADGRLVALIWYYDNSDQTIIWDRMAAEVGYRRQGRVTELLLRLAEHIPAETAIKIPINVANETFNLYGRWGFVIEPSREFRVIRAGQLVENSQRLRKELVDPSLYEELYIRNAVSGRTSVQRDGGATAPNSIKTVNLHDIIQKVKGYENYLWPPLGAGVAVFAYSISPFWSILTGVAFVTVIGVTLATLDYQRIKKIDPDLLSIARGNPFSLTSAVQLLALGLDGIFDMREVRRSPGKLFVNLTRVMYALPAGLIWTAMELAIDYFNGLRRRENILKSKFDMMRLALQHSSGINPLKVMYMLFSNWCFARDDIERRFMLYETTLLHVRGSSDLAAAKEDTFQNNTFLAAESAFYHMLQQLKLEEFDETLNKIKSGDNILYKWSKIKKDGISSDDLLNLYLAERNRLWQVRQDRGLTQQDSALAAFLGSPDYLGAPEHPNMPYYAFVVLKLLDRHFNDYFSPRELLGTPGYEKLFEMEHYLTNEQVISGLVEARIVIENGEEHFLSENFKQNFKQFLDTHYREITEADLSNVPEHEGALRVDGKFYRWAQAAAPPQRDGGGAVSGLNIPENSWKIAGSSDARYLETEDIYDCIAAIFYDRKTKAAVLAHFSLESDVRTMVGEITAALKNKGVENISRLEISLVGDSVRDKEGWQLLWNIQNAIATAGINLTRAKSKEKLEKIIYPDKYLKVSFDRETGNYKVLKTARKNSSAQPQKDGGTSSAMPETRKKTIAASWYPGGQVITEPSAISLKNVITGKDFELRKIYPDQNSFSVWIDNVKVDSSFEFDEGEDAVEAHNMAVQSEYASQGIGLTLLRYLADRARAAGKDLVLHDVFSYAVVRMCDEYISKNARYRLNGEYEQSFAEINWLEELGPIKIRIADRYLLEYEKIPGSENFVYRPSENEDEDALAETISVRSENGKVLAAWKSAEGKEALKYQVFLSEGLSEIRIKSEDIMPSKAEADGGAQALVPIIIYGKEYGVPKDVLAGIKLCDGRNYKNNNPAAAAQKLLELYAQIHPDFYILESPENKKYYLRRFARLLRGGDAKELMWVYQPNPAGAIEGYLTAELFPYDEHNPQKNKSVFMGSVSVDPAKQQQGVAKALWMEAMKFMEDRGAETFQVTTLSPYTARIAENLGWEKTVEGKNKNGNNVIKYRYNAYDGGTQSFVEEIKVWSGSVQVLAPAGKFPVRTIAAVYPGSLDPSRKEENKEHKVLLVLPSGVTNYTPEQCLEIARRLPEANGPAKQDLGIVGKNTLEQILAENFLIVEDTMVIIGPDDVILTAKVGSIGDIRDLVFRERGKKKVLNRGSVEDRLDNLKREILAGYRSGEDRIKAFGPGQQDGGKLNYAVEEINEFYRNKSADLAATFFSFREYMKEALYNQKWGYYGSGKAKIGRWEHGDAYDFSTYPEMLSPVFGQMVGERVFDMWKSMIKAGNINPGEKFQILELGAGNGTLAKDMLEFLEEKTNSRDQLWREFQDNFQYVIGERSGGLREKQAIKLKDYIAAQKLRIEDADARDILTLNRGSFKGVVISNELLDAFEVHKVRVRENSGRLSFEVCFALPTIDINTLKDLEKYLSEDISGFFDLSEQYRAKFGLPAQGLNVYLSRDQFLWLMNKLAEHKNEPFAAKIKQALRFKEIYLQPEDLPVSEIEGIEKYLNNNGMLIIEKIRREQKPAVISVNTGISRYMDSVAALLNAPGNAGYILTVDYGGSAYSVITGSPSSINSFRSMKQIKKSANPYLLPGESDITSDVNANEMLTEELPLVWYANQGSLFIPHSGFTPTGLQAQYGEKFSRLLYGDEDLSIMFFVMIQSSKNIREQDRFVYPYYSGFWKDAGRAKGAALSLEEMMFIDRDKWEELREAEITSMLESSAFGASLADRQELDNLDRGIFNLHSLARNRVELTQAMIRASMLAPDKIRVLEELENKGLLRRGLKDDKQQKDGGAAKKDGGMVDPGGVDFRQLPVSGQPSAVPVLMPQLQKLAQNSQMKDLDREWIQIRGEMLAPEMPYNRIKEYIAVCLSRPGSKGKLDRAVSCIIDILRMEEDQALATSQELKDILMCLS